MRLKPASSRPTSLPSSTGTATSSSPISTRAMAVRTAPIGPAIEREAIVITIHPTDRPSADRNATAPARRAGSSPSIARPIVATTRMPSSGTPVPSDHAIVEPRGHARGAAARRRPAGKREHGDRARDALGEQVADRAGGLAAEQDRAADHERRPSPCSGTLSAVNSSAAIAQKTALIAAKRSAWPSATSRSSSVGGPPRSEPPLHRRALARAPARPRARAPTSGRPRPPPRSGRARGQLHPARTGRGSPAAGRGPGRRGRSRSPPPRQAGGCWSATLPWPLSVPDGGRPSAARSVRCVTQTRRALRSFAQALGLGQGGELAQRGLLDLARALAGEAEHLRHLVERAASPPSSPKRSSTMRRSR